MNVKFTVLIILIITAISANTSVPDSLDCGEISRMYISAPLISEKHQRSLSRADFMREVLKRGNFLRALFRNYTCEEEETLDGYVKIKFQINKDGTVNKASCIETNFKSNKFISEIEKHTSSFVFNIKKEPKKGLIIAEYRFVFNQKP